MIHRVCIGRIDGGTCGEQEILIGTGEEFTRAWVCPECKQTIVITLSAPHLDPAKQQLCQREVS